MRHTPGSRPFRTRYREGPLSWTLIAVWELAKVKRGRDRRPWTAGPRRRSMSSTEQKAPARSAKRAVQLTLPLSMASKSAVLSIPTVPESVNPMTEGASVAVEPARRA